MKEELPFLSPEWVHEVTRVIQATRRVDKDFGKLASGFTLGLLYMITEPPQELKNRYNGQRLAIFVLLDKGTVKKLQIGTELPQEKIDFTVTSTYNVAKQIFLGELNAATSFMNGQLKIEPMSRVYQNPRFTAKSIVTGNMMLKIAKQIPTVFVPEDLEIATVSRS